MSAITEKPRLRQGLTAAREGEKTVVVWDNRRITQRMVRLSLAEFTWAQLLDGRVTLVELQQQATIQAGGNTVAIEQIAALVAKMDDALLVESPKFPQSLQC